MTTSRLNLTIQQCICPNLNPTVGTFINTNTNHISNNFSITNDGIIIQVTGTYRITASITFEANPAGTVSGGTRSLRIVKNISNNNFIPLQVLPGNGLLAIATADATNIFTPVTLVANTNFIQLNSGDVIRFVAAQSSRRGLNINQPSTPGYIIIDAL